ncbi:inactive rhomboid protein 1 isoform X2 [Folsomia candida]|uniref:inactive rhomboid protein 1 isoform X2 n=1 Tax=Folsomia candida TaxID=158441 RepID=UPI0016053279|nr:inactive rhomboid protein 1 isoform X2 [Folsomia candida]
MKASDEEEYGNFYTSRSGNGQNRYRYTREYSPSRGHHSNSPSSNMGGGDPSPYNLPQGRSYSRSSSGYGTTSRSSGGGGGMGNEYQPQPPPCCHQFYHPPPPPIPLHSSPSHFNTIPHPPLQYRDVPACATLNRSCYNSRRSNNHPYTSSSYYGTTEPSPYADPRSDIYYTSTLTRHPRHSSSRGFPPEQQDPKIYDAPPSQSYHHPSLSTGGGGGGASGLGSSGGSSSGNIRNYGVSVGGMGNVVPVLSGVGMSGLPPGQTSSILRLDEPRIYSSSALQLGSNASSASLQRSSSPQHHAPHFIDRSISLIRLDNSGNQVISGGGGASISSTASNTSAAGGNNGGVMADSGVGSSVTLSSGGAQPRFVLPHFRIKFADESRPENLKTDGIYRTFAPDLQSQQQQQAQRASQQQNESTVASNLVKTAIELGSSSDPLAVTSITPNKTKFKTLTILENTCKPVVEMSDKAVQSSQLPEQWSLVSSGSESRRISVGAVSPPGNSPPPAPTLGGVPDLLPTCIVRHGPEYASNNNPWRNSGNILPSSPRRSFHNGASGPSCPNGPSSSRGCTSKNIGAGSSLSATYSQSHHYNPIMNSINHQPPCQQPHNVPGNLHNQKETKWNALRKYIRGETKTFFGLDETTELKEEWLSRRKRFASRRYSERNVDSMPPPSPYQLPPVGHLGGHGPMHPHNHDQPDAGRIPALDSRAVGRVNGGRSRRTRKKDHVFVIYWNVIRWIFWSIRFGRTGQRVAAGAGCGSDTNPGAAAGTPGRVPLASQMSRDRTRSRSVSPNTLSELPPSVNISPQELFFDDLEENIRNSTHHLQPPGRGLHWRIARSYPAMGGMQHSNRIPAQLLNKVLDNSERQQFRQGIRQPTSSPSKLCLIDEYEDFRPYFTYWISIVQIVILIVIMILYGLAPVGMDLHRKSSLVLVTSLSLQQMEVIQPANFWVGPSAGDLIHLGAKYAPCMRRDDVIYRRIVETRDRERQTACCIRNDNSGCVQSSRNECSNLLSTWKKWTRDDGPGGRISGSVCGLDPKYCEAPASIAPYEWPDDITKWPICRKTRGIAGLAQKDKTAEHMVCEVIGHPCCIGIHAKCLITTREYCRFVNGYFHEEASLCSQVSCLQDVCGMFPFLAEDHPDQFYRLISSLFLHAGLGHIMITLVFHMFILRDVEKLAGPLRTMCIYMGAGIAGNLASVLLEPHRAEVGPGGSQYGLLACLLVELLHMWGMLRRPWQALGKMSLVIGILFIIGFLPWVDNFAHAAGFVAGFLLSHALMPYIAFGKYSTYRKWLEVVICLSGYFAILVTLLIVFYLGVGDCEICSWCKVLNCLPLTPDFCGEQEINFKPSGGGINLIT